MADNLAKAIEKGRKLYLAAFMVDERCPVCGKGVMSDACRAKYQAGYLRTQDVGQFAEADGYDTIWWIKPEEKP